MDASFLALVRNAFRVSLDAVALVASPTRLWYSAMRIIFPPYHAVSRLLSGMVERRLRTKLLRVTNLDPCLLLGSVSPVDEDVMATAIASK